MSSLSLLGIMGIIIGIMIVISAIVAVIIVTRK